VPLNQQLSEQQTSTFTFVRFVVAVQVEHNVVSKVKGAENVSKCFLLLVFFARPAIAEAIGQASTRRACCSKENWACRSHVPHCDMQQVNPEGQK